MDSILEYQNRAHGTSKQTEFYDKSIPSILTAAFYVGELCGVIKKAYRDGTPIDNMKLSINYTAAFEALSEFAYLAGIDVAGAFAANSKAHEVRRDMQKIAELPVPAGYKHRIFYPILGLVNEATEAGKKVAEAITSGSAYEGFKEEDKDKIASEVGDTLWYAQEVSGSIDRTLADIALANVNKLESRKARGKIEGSGDNR